MKLWFRKCMNGSLVTKNCTHTIFNKKEAENEKVKTYDYSWYQTRKSLRCLRSSRNVINTSITFWYTYTSQNYDYTLNEVFFEELGLRAPDYYLGCC